MKTSLLRAALACAALGLSSATAFAFNTTMASGQVSGIPIAGVKIVLENDIGVVNPASTTSTESMAIPTGAKNGIAVTNPASTTSVKEMVMPTDTNGSVTFTMKPGKYVLVIKGADLIAAMDKLAPPEKKESVGKSIPIGGNGGNPGSNPPPSLKITMYEVFVTLDKSLPEPVSVNVPYCPDAFASQDLRTGFMVPEGPPATVVMTIFDRWGN